jgi:hypothetical protein
MRLAHDRRESWRGNVLERRHRVVDVDTFRGEARSTGVAWRDVSEPCLLEGSQRIRCVTGQQVEALVQRCAVDERLKQRVDLITMLGEPSD